ncbi:MAG: phosphatase PAP2 family protein [Opitutaceae bacterium]|nr:phosphatase PAP2 family protein [Opitutaceae bacterium]
MNQIKTFLAATNAISPRRLIVSTGIAAAVLIVPALMAWIAGWCWAPDGGAWITAAVIVTDSAGFPCVIATSGVLAVLFLFLIKPARLREIIAFIVLGTAAVGCAQGIKSLLKNIVREPRPYVVWLGQTRALDSDVFYKMPRDTRAAWIEKNLASEPRVPAVLREHWKSETGFSFPSGHTAFVAVWTMLGAALLWARGRGGRVVCCAVALWAVAVEFTRLALGMHWPADVAISALLGWVTVVVLVAIWKKFATRGADDGADNATRDPASNPAGDPANNPTNDPAGDSASDAAT